MHGLHLRRVIRWIFVIRDFFCTHFKYVKSVMAFPYKIQQKFPGMQKSKWVNDRLFKGNYSTDEIKLQYDKWAQHGEYAKDLSPAHYKGPEITAKTAALLFSKRHRAEIRILDVAAGTGFVAEQLRGHGFKQIHALDPSKGMLDEARKKNLYSSYTYDFLGKDVLQDRNGYYDCITICGGFGKGHIPASALYDVIRLTKNDGYVIIAMREEYLKLSCYDGILEPLMKSLEKDKAWKMIQKRMVSDYAFGLTGLIYLFKVSHRRYVTLELQ